jgi:asparagine synthase (glutamine-hydrolysing)
VWRGWHLRCPSAGSQAGSGDDAGDGEGFFNDEHIALGMRRLAIVDVAGGQQPQANETRTVWIVFNGEIYNHADLRSELVSYGHMLRTTSDTEAILHGYEQWGIEGCLKRLRGMFAFLLWDAARVVRGA